MQEPNLDKLTSICRNAIDSFTGNSKEEFAEYLATELSEHKATILPFSVGDKLYRANSWLDQVDELTVSMLTQKKDGSWKIRTTSATYKAVQDFSLAEIADPKYDIYRDRKEAEISHKKAREARFEALKQKVMTLGQK